MNIFVTSKCPVESAQYLDTVRVNKMILESAQLLCTALHSVGIDAPYKSTHVNHPANIWCRYSRENYLWLWEHYNALLNVMYERRGTIHKSGEFKFWLKSQAKHLLSLGLSPFANCAANEKLGISYKHIDDVCLAYQLYLSDRWEMDKREPVWS
jgi:hypothetical protein